MSDAVSGRLKIFKIVLWCILGIILLMILIVVGTLLIQKYIKKSSVPMFMGYGSLIVTTGSMNGTIDQGDLIIVKRTNDYELGDIVTYVEAEGKTPVTHRLVNYGEEEGTFITKGDANKSTDIFPISVDQIAGEVVVVIPKIGIFFDWFLYEGGLIYTVAIIAVAVAGVYFWNITKSETEEGAASGESTEVVGDNPEDAPKGNSDNSTGPSEDAVKSAEDPSEDNK